jgi:hypothetical protein
MTTYRVTWEIDVEADSHEEAAREALAIQRDPMSHAIVFTVRNAKRWKDCKTIDLLHDTSFEDAGAVRIGPRRRK